MKIIALIVPLLFIITFLFAIYKKIPLYDSFVEGIKGAIPLIISVFPYIATVFMLSKLFTISGLEERVLQFLSPVFSYLGIPFEIAELIFIKPLSGSGSTAILSNIVEMHGIDSYVSRCACAVYASTETVFYIGAVYFAKTNGFRTTKALFISLLVYLLSVIFACFLCRIL